MMNRLGLLALTLALSGCETPRQSTASPVAAAPLACTPVAFTLADGRRVMRTCRIYRGCTTFAVDVPPAHAPRPCRSLL